MKKRERHIRAHALREGDELWHDHKWWQVGAEAKPGQELKGRDPRSGEETVQLIPQWVDLEHGVCRIIRRGSLTTVIIAPKTGVVKIMRGDPVKA